jgi:hypothetical protein
MSEKESIQARTRKVFSFENRVGPKIKSSRVFKVNQSNLGLKTA